jgi:hypothetical protein
VSLRHAAYDLSAAGTIGQFIRANAANAQPASAKAWPQNRVIRLFRATAPEGETTLGAEPMDKRDKSGEKKSTLRHKLEADARVRANWAGIRAPG